MKKPAHVHMFSGACALLLLSALPSFPQDGTWEKLDLPAAGQTIWKDLTRTDAWDHEEPRLAADATGKLYFSNGSNLLISSDGGVKWDVYAHPNLTQPLTRGFKLAAGGQGLVAWGAQHSQDGGKTWENLPFYPSDGAFGCNRHNAFLMGAGNDQIFKMDAPYIDWVPVYQGRMNFGFIYQFASSNVEYTAALGIDALYLSADSGWSWQAMERNAAFGVLSGGSIQSMALEPRKGESLWMTPRRLGSRDKGLIHVNMLTRTAEKVAGNVPDSTVNVIRVGLDGAIWLGTWGQGMWVSRNEGKTFTAQNDGLNSVFVKALQETSDGRMFALTPTGLFRLRGTGSGVRPSRAFRAGESRKAYLYLPGLPGSLRNSGHVPGSEPAYLIDGRKVGLIPALATKEPKTKHMHKEANP